MKESDNKKYIIHSIALLSIVMCYFLYVMTRSFTEVGLIVDNNYKIVPLHFYKGNQTLYICMQDYGLNLQYVKTVISRNNLASENVIVNDDLDVVRHGVDKLCYKMVQPDSLLIIEPSWNSTDSIHEKIMDIYIIIKEMSMDSLKLYVSQQGFQMLDLYGN